MQFEGNRRNSHVPNMTPLIDIVFLLTSHFVQDDALNIQLPETESGKPLDEKKVLKSLSMLKGSGYTTSR